MQTKSGPILMGIAYLGLVVLIILFCAYRSSNFDDYSKYFGLFGTLVGVATGAIPGFFFKTQADKATDLASKANDRADKESTKVQLYAGALDPEKINDVKRDNPDLFH
ncbi:MAG: hypothetical protein ACRDSH_07880 [Pseudonocardiaceae bacterium]